MGLLATILVLELGPMLALIRWRVAVARGGAPDTGAASRFARISVVQAILVVLMVLAATAMARGYGVSRKVDSHVPKHQTPTTRGSSTDRRGAAGRSVAV